MTRTEDPPVFDTLTGDLSFVDNGGTRCPRQGKAIINFVSSKSGNVHYSPDCTNGHFSGVVQTVPGTNSGFCRSGARLFCRQADHQGELCAKDRGARQTEGAQSQRAYIPVCKVDRG